ncbi:MAG: hypothetical protein K2X86_05270, partial [Cytophagaceae bacterium]|nr:hypothetical protein [Cytophagaceae bacterium]
MLLLIFISNFTQAGTEILKLRASKSYKPNIWNDADTTLLFPGKFSIPAEINVISGNAGSHKAILQYRLGNGSIVTLTYKGGSDREEPSSKSGIGKGKKYIFFKSSNGLNPGALAEADYFHLRIEQGSQKFGTTMGEINMPLALVYQAGVIKCLSGSVVLFFNTENPLSSVKWNPGNVTGLNIPSDINWPYKTRVVVPSYTGPYTITATFTDGTPTLTRTLTAIYETNAPSPAILASANPNPVCQGNPVNLTASGVNTGGTYSWVGTNGFVGSGANVTNTPLSNTVYTVTGTNSNGCSNSVSIPVNVTPLAINITANGDNCPGKTMTLTASGATSYVWSGPSIVGPD